MILFHQSDRVYFIGPEHEIEDSFIVPSPVWLVKPMEKTTDCIFDIIATFPGDQWVNSKSKPKGMCQWVNLNLKPKGMWSGCYCWITADMTNVYPWQSVKKLFSASLLFSKQNRPPFHSWHNHDFHINNFIHFMHVVKQMHKMSGKYLKKIQNLLGKYFSDPLYHFQSQFSITLTPYMVLPLFATRFADYTGGIRVSFI